MYIYIYKHITKQTKTQNWKQTVTKQKHPNTRKLKHRILGHVQLPLNRNTQDLPSVFSIASKDVVASHQKSVGSMDHFTHRTLKPFRFGVG